MAEANEPPADALRRELREEPGLGIKVGDILCVDWVSPHGPRDDLLNFIFDGGPSAIATSTPCVLSTANCAPSSSATKARPKNASGPTSGAGQAPHWKH
jgi:8-oxo-dGTP diphosphatase